MLKIYVISYKYSNDGRSYYGKSENIKAETQSDAMAMVNSKYPYVKDIRIISVH